ncbi:lactonase family protein [Pantoea sp. 18069]|uniref:lactonase family protein n=1 Tax=Pantoea sp. 18069 TaxID=2681415 RepID=UPI00135A0198|nr:lactonase family protein [Pantoea sp. 18069]
MYAYVGSRTTRERQARGDGISIFEVDTRSGALRLVDVVGGLVNPSFLAMGHDGQCLYTVHGDASEVSAFRVDRASGRLTFLNRQDTQGHNPVHLALDPSGRYLVVSNHLGASLSVLAIDEDGALGGLLQQVALNGPLGPHRVEQRQAKPHCNPFDPGGRFVAVADKGLDRVFMFRFEQGRLTPAAQPFTPTREAAGPRHLAFHPCQAWAYVVNELDSTVTAYRFDADSGALTPFQIVPALPEHFTGNSRAAEIQIDASGRFLYASNRGADCMAVFHIDAATGALASVESVSSMGRTPRFVTTSPDARLLFALNEDSDSIVSFAIDAASGRLQPTGASVRCASPVCMVFSR